ncbi:MAG: aminomethyl-transferring glycine dehydrogenase subunit GcvPB [Conexivisphaerales archaeon]
MFRQAKWDEGLLVEIGKEGRIGYVPPEPLGPDVQLRIPEHLVRKELNLPSLTEAQVVRHFVRLSQMNYAVDLGIYPLGSCTMKFNPKLNDRIANDERVTNAHPYQHHSTVQGLLSLLYELQTNLAEITGMDEVSLLPAAGAHGELVGVLMIRKYLQSRGQHEKNEILIPDSAHGTNPASAAMADFDVITVPSDERGMVSFEDLKKLVGKKTAGMMMTVPNTLGLFEEDILKISKLIHENGGLMYYDGANMNAILGRVRPGDIGFDIVHMNLHKTFSTPHGGGGPGSGPVGVKAFLREYMPVPILEKKGESYSWRHDLPHTIGRIKEGYGNVGVLIRALSYLLTLGPEGLVDVSSQSVVASNYLLRKLEKQHYQLNHGQNYPRKHEFVVSAKPLTKNGVNALRVAKALLDEGLHPPTIYFPLIVDEAMMVEPTESEPVEELDRYAEAMNSIARRSAEELASSPKNTSVKTLDEAKASHPLTLRLTWRSQKK